MRRIPQREQRQQRRGEVDERFAGIGEQPHRSREPDGREFQDNRDQGRGHGEQGPPRERHTTSTVSRRTMPLHWITSLSFCAIAYQILPLGNYISVEIVNAK